MSLPSGYKRLEYIQSSGTQYIDTGVAANGNTGFAVDFSTTSAVSTSGYGSILGCLNYGSNRYGIGTYPDRSGGQLCYGSAIYNPYITVGNRLQVSLLNGSIKTPNGTETVGAQTFNVGATITVFGRKRTDGSVDELSKTKIYALTIYDNGDLVRDFIPCQKPDGTNGLWDDVNSVFYGNSGTGTFAAGPVIAIAADKSEITKLEYIQSSGTQYVNTGVVVSKNLEIKLRFMLTSTTNHGIIGYMQSASSGTNRFAVFQYGGAWYFDFGNESTGRISGGSFNANTLYDISVGNRYIKDNASESNIISGSVISDVTNSNFISILCETDCGIGKIYSCQIYDNDVLVRDYIAAKLADGTVGLYDKLNGLLYINSGTGTFEAGPSSLNLPVNIGGTWKDANEAFVNVGGTWKTVEAAFVNIDGTWKELS